MGTSFFTSDLVQTIHFADKRARAQRGQITSLRASSPLEAELCLELRCSTSQTHATHLSGWTPGQLSSRTNKQGRGESSNILILTKNSTFKERPVSLSLPHFFQNSSGLKPLGGWEGCPHIGAAMHRVPELGEEDIHAGDETSTLRTRRWGRCPQKGGKQVIPMRKYIKGNERQFLTIRDKSCKYWKGKNQNEPCNVGLDVEVLMWTPGSQYKQKDSEVSIDILVCTADPWTPRALGVPTFCRVENPSINL